MSMIACSAAAAEVALPAVKEMVWSVAEAVTLFVAAETASQSRFSLLILEEADAVTSLETPSWHSC